MKSALTIRLIWADLLFRFCMISADVLLRNASYHIDRLREGYLDLLIIRAGEIMIMRSGVLTTSLSNIDCALAS